MAVARAIANGQDLELFGDNLFIDFDFGAANLSIGQQLKLGDAILVVSEEPHDGCSKFAKRFGMEALQLTACKEYKHLRLRGVYLFVVSSGMVCIGDILQKI